METEPGNTEGGEDHGRAILEAELQALEESYESSDNLQTGSDGDDDGDDETAKLAAAEDSRAVAEASRKGWVPRERFTGDPATWVDAKTFIERGAKFNMNLQKEIADLKKQIASFEGTKQAFAKFHEETVAKKDAEIAEAITQLRLQRSASIREGDDEQTVAIEDRIDLLKEQQTALKAPVKQAAAPAVTPPPEGTANGVSLDSPLIQDWIEDGNQWFRDDNKLRSYAIALGESMIQDGVTVRGRKFLELVAEKMAEEFPRKFRLMREAAEAGTEGGSPRKTGIVEGAGDSAGTGRRGGKTENDLPAEDRKLMHQFIQSGWTTKEKFLKSYFSNTGTHK